MRPEDLLIISLLFGFIFGSSVALSGFHQHVFVFIKNFEQ